MLGLTHSVTIDRRGRLLRWAALIAAATLLSLIFASTTARADSKPTVVLVHGAFASPEGWTKVTDALHKDGYQTATPALDMDSVAGDVATVRSTLDSIAGDKILVGHSYGGFVITNAASGRTDVSGLVYAAAFVPDTGETITSLGVGYTPGTFLTHLIPAPSGFPKVIDDPRFYAADFAQELNPKLAAEITAQQRPTSVFVFGTPSGPGAWHDIPSWYAISGADRAIDPDLERFMAERAGSATVQFDDASHVGALTHYSARFVKLIEQAAGATN
jgi:pimeloyl-ACP methyl ester carboxylesterase